MAKQSITAAVNGQPSDAERVKDFMDRNARASILTGYAAAISDVITSVSSDKDFEEALGKETLPQLHWLLLDIAEQAKATLDGYMPPDLPSYESPWVVEGGRS